MPCIFLFLSLSHSAHNEHQATQSRDGIVINLGGVGSCQQLLALHFLVQGPLLLSSSQLTYKPVETFLSSGKSSRVSSRSFVTSAHLTADSPERAVLDSTRTRRIVIVETFGVVGCCQQLLTLHLLVQGPLLLLSLQ